jgi:phosphatidate phosphatase APP1
MADRGSLSRFLRDAFNVGAAARDVIVRRIPRAPLGVALFDGYGTRDRILVHGRALRDEKIPAQQAGDPRWRNLLATLRRVDADPIPHAVVRVRAGSIAQDFPADDEGFFHGWMSSREPERIDAHWAWIGAELVSPAGDAPVAVRARVLLPADPPRLLVISDIDDTVLQSRVTNLVVALRTMLLENAHTRLPFPGVAAFYRALAAGPGGDEHNAMFYVSSSPWNVYDVIAEFLQIHGIPHGPLLLRDVDIGFDALSARHHHSHKRETIRRVLQTYPEASAVLIGDSGQQDPEIYRDVVHEFQGRIRAIYIRDVSGRPERARVIEQLSREVLEAGSTLLLTADTLAAASHAVELGLIDPAALEDVRAEE